MYPQNTHDRPSFLLRLRVIALAFLAPGGAVAWASPQEEPSAVPRPVRVGLRARAGGAAKLTPLRYTGGFEPKTMLYETLVRCGEGGRIVPGLASSWAIEDAGRSVSFTLRAGARFHDGEPVTPAAVRDHFRRWIGFREHDWLASNRHIVDVLVTGENTFRVVLDEPWALLPDLCAINPCAIQGPGSRDREGEFVLPVGTGPFRWVKALDEEGRRWRVERFADGVEAAFLDVTVFERGGNEEPLDALVRGELDAFVGGWDEDLPGVRLDALRTNHGMQVLAEPGSAVVSLRFLWSAGPTADRDVRLRIADAVDRDELVARAEGGYADPCTAWAAPSVTTWPRSSRAARTPTDARRRTVDDGIPLTLRAGRGARTERVAALVAEQLARAGFAPRLLEAGEADVTVAISHGVPYDPHATLASAFLRSRDEPRFGSDELRDLVERVQRTPELEARLPLYARIQEVLDRDVALVPLYAPRRIAVHAARVTGVRLGVDVYHVDLTELRWREVGDHGR